MQVAFRWLLPVQRQEVHGLRLEPAHEGVSAIGFAGCATSWPDAHSARWSLSLSGRKQIQLGLTPSLIVPVTFVASCFSDFVAPCHVSANSSLHVSATSSLHVTPQRLRRFSIWYCRLNSMSVTVKMSQWIWCHIVCSMGFVSHRH